jgi:hypothetical protein
MSDGPKLLVFSPCERVIINEEDNASSLIAILQGFHVQSEIPDGKILSLPISWYVYTLWESDKTENKYHQRTELISPTTGKTLVTASAQWQFVKDKYYHRLTGRVVGFPVDGFGKYELRLSLKINDGAFVERASFPIWVAPAPASS